MKPAKSKPALPPDKLIRTSKAGRIRLIERPPPRVVKVRRGGASR